ncbi:hypothetical protein ACFVYA_20950 [Amycolatopsis sp. NPDC058278]
MTSVVPATAAGGGTQVITLSGTSLHQSETVRVTPRGGAPSRDGQDRLG